MELDQYLGLFIDESKENLQKLNESLLKLENNTDDLDILNDIFRVAHTLKGMSKTMGFNNIADLTHNMENVLEPLRSGTIKADTRVLDVLFKCLDQLEALIGKVIDGNYEDSNDAIIGLVQVLQDILNNKPTEDQAKAEKKEVTFNEYEMTIFSAAADKSLSPKEILVTLADDCVLTGVRAYMTIRAVEALGEIVKSIPSTEELENGDFEKSFKLYLITGSTNEQVFSAIDKISEIAKVEVKDLKTKTEADRTGEQPESSTSAPVEENSTNETENGEEVNRSEDQVQDVSESETPEQETPVAPQPVQRSQTATEPTHPSVSKLVPQTIRVSSQRMDQLMNLVGELVINRTRVVQISTELKSQDLSSSVGLMSKITTDIQEIVMKLRMVPIEQVFNRFPRLVRDISKNLGKDINLVITGKDTEIDRVVIDEIGDPLVHLIRNSLDHGLETPEDRIAAGKTAKGTLELSAFNEGDNILIKVCDDGRGIDPAKIKEIAVTKGIITEEIAKNLTDREAIELIFAPGFSTAKVATDISGRGVGMDVVKSKVTQLGGNVTVTSKINEGSTIIISLPSSMAIVQALLIKVGEETYAAPLNYISEVIDISQKQIKNIQNKEVIVLRGKTLPLIRLHKLLEVPNYKEEPDQSLTVVIIKTQGKYFGVIVSELIGQQEVVIKPINKKLCSEDYISGATTLGNGQVALIINVNSLITQHI